MRKICQSIEKLFGTAKRESWISIYSDVGESPDVNEDRAYVCAYEFEKLIKLRKIESRQSIRCC